jgi:hypothetical protein
LTGWPVYVITGGMTSSLDRFALALFLPFAGLSAGCASAPDTETALELRPAPTAAPYVIWQQSSACLITKSLEPSIRMCVTGYNASHAQQQTKASLLQWLDAVRDLNPAVTSTIEFTCDNPHGRLTVDNTGEYSYAGDVHVRSNSAPGTYLHEFGHAFACLGDTYVSGTAGYCAYGQPHSIMCDGLLRNDLTADDIAGVRKQFLAMVGGSDGGGEQPKPKPPVDANDTDGDGVPNKDDRCSKTPAGSHVWGPGQWHGCAAGEYVDNYVGGGDSDGDGVPDDSDRCPTTPKGKWVWTYQYNGYWRGCASGEVPTK